MSKMNAKNVFFTNLLFVLLLMSISLQTNSFPFIHVSTIEDEAVDSYLSSTSIFDDSETPVVTNIVKNGNFDEFESNGGPKYWSKWGSGTSYVNRSYTGLTYGGSNYAGNLKAKGTDKFNTNAYLRPIIQNIYLKESIIADMQINLKFPDVSNGALEYLQLNIYNSSVGVINLYYYLSHTNTPTNTSNTYYYFLNQTVENNWNNFHRNITADVESLYGPVGSSIYLRFFYIYITSITKATGFTELTIDDFTLTNKTGYNYHTSNGNFEVGDGSNWYKRQNSSPSLISSSSDSHAGKAVNLSTSTLTDNAPANANLEVYMNWPNGIYSHTNSIIDFFWKINAVNNSGVNQNAFFSMYGWNKTHSVYLNFYAHTNLDQFSFSNTSSPSTYMNYNMKLPGFGTKNQWTNSKLNISRIAQELNLTEQIFNDFYFTVNSGQYKNSTVNLLIDDFKIETYPALDPGFEYEGYWNLNEPIIGWNNLNGMNATYANKSTFSHSGKYSIRVNSTAGNSVISSVSTFFSVKKSYFTDFWWYLDEIDASTPVYAYFKLIFDGGYNLYYIVASSSTWLPSNTSFDAYYYSNDFNSSLSWKNLNRNIYNDLNSFDQSQNSWNLSSIRFEVSAQGSGYINTYIDDINIIQDTHGPKVTEVSYNPAPEYKSNPNIVIKANDRYGTVASVTLYYKEYGTWEPLSGIFNQSHYVFTLNPLPSISQLQFYINLTDGIGNSNIDNNNGLYYSMQITIPAPVISNLYLIPSTPVHQEAVQVILAVTDINDVMNTTLWYKIGENGTWQSKLMNSSGLIYQATIPGNDWNTKVYYYVESENIYGFKSYQGNATNPIQYRVTDLIDPVLTVIGPQVSSLKGITNFTITGSDGESGVDNLIISIDGTKVAEESSLPTLFSLDTSTLNNGQHTITFSLSDKAGNTVTYAKEYNIINPEGLDAVVDDFNSQIKENGVIFGAIGVISAYIGVKVIIWFIKRKRAP